MVDKICECDHLEKDHRYMDMSPEELMDHFVRMGSLVPVYGSDQARPTGYRVIDGTFVFYGDALAQMKSLQLKNSPCTKKRFFKGCKCNAFKADNLKTLENAYEHTTD